MGKFQVPIFAAFLLIFANSSLNAQSGPVSAGNSATGNGGTASFSIGQVAFMTASGTSGSMSGGLQQPFIIESITGIEQNSLEVGYSIFPNPVVDYIFLDTDIDEKTNLIYTLYNFEGKVIDTKEVYKKMTFIPMRKYNAATYFLVITDGETVMKSFRIIKN